MFHVCPKSQSEKTAPATAIGTVSIIINGSIKLSNCAASNKNISNKKAKERSKGDTLLPKIYEKTIYYKLSPKSSRNLAASLSCQSPIASRRPKKKRSTSGSSTHFKPPIKSRLSYNHFTRSAQYFN